MAKLFLISYSEATLPKAKLVSLFDNLPGVLTWFSQIPGSFFIKTADSFTAKQVSEILMPESGNNTQIVVQIHKKVAEDYYGMLSKEIWEHFK